MYLIPQVPLTARRPHRSAVLGLVVVALFASLLGAVVAAPAGASNGAPKSGIGDAGIVGSGPACHGEVATIVGTHGDDVIRGTKKRDVIIGGRGNDVIHGLGGNDIICAGDGEDEVFGGGGRDWITGGDGYDTLLGGRGKDVINDRDAECAAEQEIGCLRLLPEHLLPDCGKAPVWVVQAVYVGFGDTPHVCYFAEHIAYRESRWTPEIIGGPNRNGTYDYGLLQLNSAYIATWAEWADVEWTEWADPFVNAQIARGAYDGANRLWGDPLRPWASR